MPNHDEIRKATEEVLNEDAEVIVSDEQVAETAAFVEHILQHFEEDGEAGIRGCGTMAIAPLAAPRAKEVLAKLNPEAAEAYGRALEGGSPLDGLFEALGEEGLRPGGYPRSPFGPSIEDILGGRRRPDPFEAMFGPKRRGISPEDLIGELFGAKKAPDDGLKEILEAIRQQMEGKPEEKPSRFARLFGRKPKQPETEITIIVIKRQR